MTTSRLTLECREDGSGGPMLRVAGEIDACSAPLLAAALGQLGADHVVVDLAEVTFVDSSGLRVLLGEQRRREGSARTLAVCNPSAAVLRLLDLSGQQVHLAETVFHDHSRRVPTP